MKLRPIDDRILVRRLASESKTAGGIIIPDSAQEKSVQGEVVAVGKGKLSDAGNLIEMTIKIGDKVLFAKWGGTEVKINGEDMLLMKESDVLAIIE